LEIKRGLQRKGFREDNRDHKFYFLYLGDKRTSVRTKISHGETEIDDGLIKLMAKQIHLTKDQFIDLVNCPLSYDEYIKILQEKGIITT